MKGLGKIGLTIGLFFGMAVAFVACNQNPPQVGQPTDPRDAFVGAYDYTSTGNLTVNIIPTQPLSIPLNNKGSFTISKYGEENKVVIVGAIFGNNDSIQAKVIGNELALESNSANVTYEDVTIQMMLAYDNATLVDATLTWEADIMAIATYGTLSANGTGHVSMVATKKQ